jgi:hypothetical protein
MKQLIRRILKEESTKQILIDEIKYFGIESAARLVGDIYNLIKVLNIETPMDFLHIFNDLDVVKSKEKPDWTLFRYKPKKNLMVYTSKSKTLHINYYEIWKVLEYLTENNYSEIIQLLQIWLSEVYNLEGVTTFNDHQLIWSLSDVYNLRGITSFADGQTYDGRKLISTI